jgi:saccharopine dehydrogenase-like NADP-dependent oxidoreductase
MKIVTVLGGTGIFGGRVARALAATAGLTLRVAARDSARGEAFAREIGARFVQVNLDDPGSLGAAIAGSALLIHAAGPFQGRDYAVARACIARGVHYLDLADAREFVTGIGALDAAARARGVFVGSGASSVPTITHALVADLAPGLDALEEIDLALSPGNQNPRGAATIGAVLGALGAPLRAWIDGAWRTRRGFGDRAVLEFPPAVGRRAVYNFAAPDLDLFPAAFGAHTVRFRAGLELPLFNGVLRALAALRSLHLVPPLGGLAPLALRVSMWFYAWGSKNGALAAWVRGRDPRGRAVERRVALVTADDGPATPSAPAILLARKLLLGEGIAAGARPTMGLLTLAELRAHLEPLGIRCVRSDAAGQWTR